MKKLLNLIKTKYLYVVFITLFVISLFATLNVFADSNPFKLTSVAVTDKSSGVTGDVNFFDNDEIKSDIVFHHLNDSVTYKLVFKNILNKDVTILSITDDNNNPYVVYEYDNYENTKLTPNQTLDFSVKATYKNEVTDLNERNQATSVKITINFLEDGEENSETIIINPKTGDKVGINFILLIISSIGLITTIYIDYRRKNHKISKSTFVIITGVILLPFAVKAASFAYNVSLKTGYKLHDKQVVTYIENGEEKQKVVPYNDVLSGLETPSKDGYTFNKWVYSNGDLFDPSKPITDDITIVPTFTPITYTITYDLDGGMMLVSNPDTYTIEDNITLAKPVKPNYDFVGWEGTDITGSLENVVINGLIGNRSYKAIYAPTDYTISYTGLTDSEIGALNNPTSYNVLTSSYTLNNPSDRLDDDGDVIQTFSGWKDGNTVSNTITIPNLSSMGNKTFEAVWTNVDPNVYTITYELNGGVLSSSNPTSFTKNTDTFTLNEPTKVGYTFKGWSGTDLTGDDNKNVQVVKGTKKDLSFTANYTANTYKVKFNNNGGEGSITDQTLTYDQATNLTINTFTKTGYTFANWNTKADGTGTMYTDGESVTNLLTDGEITLYAQWTKNSYVIEFDSNDALAQGTMNNLPAVYDTETTLTLVGYTLEGHTFAGWNTKADGTGDNYANGANVVNLATSGTVKLYAQWDRNTITISFNSNGGAAVNSIDILYGDSIGTLPSTSKDGAVFKGWFINLTDATAVDSSFAPTENIELIAKWENILCRKAITLNSELCKATGSSKGCLGAGYKANEEIIYGSIVNSDTLVPGNAFDCDVDGTGFNQRFYYLRTLDNKAVLISNQNFEGPNGQLSEHNYKYDVALTMLPTHEQWSNLNNSFDITDTITSPARFITIDDLYEVTGKNTLSDLTTNKSLENYNFLFENTTYANQSGRSTVWLKAFIDEGSEVHYRYHKDNRNLVLGGESSSNSVRPVIEVPLDLIEDSYIVTFDAIGGTVNNKYVRVLNGSSIGSLETPTYDGYIFDGWYKEQGFINAVDENTIPDGNVTYYARWISPINTATLEKDNFALEIGNSETIVVNNLSEVEEFTFASTDPEIASVDSDGVITALSEGNTTIILTGNISGTVKVVNVSVQTQITSYTVDFDTQGGTAVASVVVAKDTKIGSLPSTDKDNYRFAGWYTGLNYNTLVTENTIIDGNKTFYAKWIPVGKVAEMNGEYFDTVQDAIDSAPKTKTTIKLLEDVLYDTIIDLYTKNTDKDIVLDLQGHTIKNETINVIRTKTKLEVKNGTLIGTAAFGTVDVGPNGVFVMNSGRVENSGSRAAIYNEGGEVYIGGTSYITANADGSNSAKRASVQTLSGGKTTITGGTIVSTRDTNSYAVTATNGTLVIGTKDGKYDTENLVIQANTNGIYSTINFALYDGIIKGKTAAINNENKITMLEDNISNKVKVDEVIGGETFKTLYYTVLDSQYIVTLDPAGGDVDPTFVLVNNGDAIGTLPVPTKGVYTFDGWYDGTTIVNENTIPTGNVTYVAKWRYEASDEIVDYDVTSDVLKQYFAKINTWKQDQSTFQDNMDENFNNYNCKCRENTCTGGTNLCDKSRGYETGLSDVLIYESSATNKEKGDLASYVTISSDGTVYNMIPGNVYYWESSSDPQVHGYVRPTSPRRIINVDGVGNLRDLGGLTVDTDHDGHIDGTISYGRLFRGERLYSDTSNPLALAKLGVNEEIDLRASSEIPSNEAQLSNFKHREIKHYQLNFDTQLTNYNMARNTVIEVMNDIIDGKNIYFHCRIGTDRTGTLAYILEGLLGVSQEEMLEDYELSYFYGLNNRHRFYAEDPKSSVSKTEKFVYMYNLMEDSEGVYNWFMLGSTDVNADNALINNFRNAIINYNN